MVRFQAWVAAACVVAYALLAPVELVLCIGSDGCVVLEAAACQCCAGCSEAVEGRSSGRPEPQMGPGRGACRLCVDVPLRVQGTVQSLASSGRAAPRVSEAASPASAVPALPPDVCPLRIASSSHSPPPDIQLISLQSVVLLI